MDTKRVLIIGAVGVLSVGAYLYFRPKKTVVTGTDSSNSGLPNHFIPIFFLPLATLFNCFVIKGSVKDWMYGKVACCWGD